MSLYTKLFYEKHLDDSLSSAEIVVPIIIELLTISNADHKNNELSVLDVGCGIGTWTRVFQDNGFDVTGIDGEHIDQTQLLIEPSRFISSDLSSDFCLGKQADVLRKKYSIVISLEVAEHLPKSVAGEFVDQLCKMGDTVVFSAAIPGQGGTGHVNEQWQNYWVSHFNERNFGCQDIIRPIIFDNSLVKYWYRQNILVFKKDIINDRPLMHYRRVTVDQYINKTKFRKK